MEMAPEQLIKKINRKLAFIRKAMFFNAITKIIIK